MAGTPRFELRKSVLETDGLPLAYIPKTILVHAVGLAPTKDHSGPPDLQSGAFATRRTHAETIRRLQNSHMRSQTYGRSVFKMDEGREKHCREHTSRHTSPEDGELTDSRKAPSSSSRRLPAFISRKRYFDCQKTKGAGLNFPGKLPAPSILLIFTLRLGAGVRSR